MPTWFITWDGGCPGAIYIIWIPKEGSLRVISPCRHRKLPVLIFDWETIGKFPQIYICWCNQRSNWLPLFLVIAFVRAENIKSRADNVSGGDPWVQWHRSRALGNVLKNWSRQLGQSCSAAAPLEQRFSRNSRNRNLVQFHSWWESGHIWALVHLSTIYNIVNLYSRAG